MTAAEIIEAIKQLPREEQFRVVHLARQAVGSRYLTPEELGNLAQRMAETDDSSEGDRLQEQIMQGFYGG